MVKNNASHTRGTPVIKFLPLPLAVIASFVALPAIATPQCFMEWRGRIIDLSHMCGSGGQRNAPTSVAVEPVGSVQPFERVWAASFYNDRQFNAANQLVDTTAIEGNIHNTGNEIARNVLIQATGYAEGRLPQTQEQVIPVLGPSNSKSIRFDFDFSVPVEAWDVEVVSWD